MCKNCINEKKTVVDLRGNVCFCLGHESRDLQCCEKVSAPYQSSYFLACVSHLTVPDRQTNSNIKQR